MLVQIHLAFVCLNGSTRVKSSVHCSYSDCRYYCILRCLAVAGLITSKTALSLYNQAFLDAVMASENDNLPSHTSWVAVTVLVLGHTVVVHELKILIIWNIKL